MTYKKWSVPTHELLSAKAPRAKVIRGFKTWTSKSVDIVNSIMTSAKYVLLSGYLVWRTKSEACPACMWVKRACEYDIPHHCTLLINCLSGLNIHLWICYSANHKTRWAINQEHPTCGLALDPTVPGSNPTSCYTGRPFFFTPHPLGLTGNLATFQFTQHITWVLLQLQMRSQTAYQSLPLENSPIDARQ